MKHAYVFPGQGAQFTGMAKDLYDKGGKGREMLENANDILGFRITDIMFEGSDEELKQTRVTQPAVFLHSVVKAVEEYGAAPDMVAGHSLGEFSALAVSGALDFEDALKLVSVRALAMQKACEGRRGAMAAIIGLPAGTIERICSEVSGGKRGADGVLFEGCAVGSPLSEDAANGTPLGVVVAANYNSDAQTVISGDTTAVEAACEALKAEGAKRALLLQVGGAFHSPLMEPARAELAEAIEKVSLHTPQCPIYQNFTASPSTDPEVIKRNLLSQLTGPVRWSESVRNMAGDAARSEGVPAAEAIDFTEIGPGTTLTGLIRRIAF